MSGDFRFDAPRNLAVYVCEHVGSSGQPILLVVHDAEGDWQFRCGGDHGDDEKPMLVGLGHVVDDDPSVNELAELCTNHTATRASREAPWEIVDDELGNRVRGGGAQAAHGARVGGLLEGAMCLLVEVDRTHYRDYFGYALWYRQGPSFRAFQIVWPSKASGKLPWQTAVSRCERISPCSPRTRRSAALNPATMDVRAGCARRA